ncbi:hypothetical protein M409DRAFT_66048 [Zasmidium cellare ATCC 36951]|uniref:Heterokaryon incompatibility domain-containing protein n=1 Tax=Zasmidium cellare ATCC 36951 TaxID=1080233 RepID=A0A6A6CMV8_ZASCE|nr:uncharacterized protein M409DRAFT_66048 [Zasmidium cellare ATCC 36951]KAF2167490.1 hypothetical protein M409DRAFT_66048 [Zasmidium cellare ATCC 36951]
MRLINVHSLDTKDFSASWPEYAILSHRWEDDEISYQDYQDPSKRTGAGYRKIKDFCLLVQQADWAKGQAMRRRIEWAWVDTCCIDKTSSAELSEAINSMWTWYQEAAVCVAYISDYHPRTLRHCQWFSRGWTLQELLAPMHVLFYSQFWRLVGSRDELATKDSWLVEATGIEAVFLEKYTNVRSASVAQRMGWAARRRTTRQEDMAYCLMGLFDVNMPLLYGEGWSKAFLRLQSEIIRQSDDESIFVFYKQPNVAHSGVLAKHPAAFKHSTLVRTQSRVERSPFMVTHKGLQIDGPALGIKTTNTYPDQSHLCAEATARRGSPSYDFRASIGAHRES